MALGREHLPSDAELYALVEGKTPNIDDARLLRNSLMQRHRLAMDRGDVETISETEGRLDELYEAVPELRTID